MEVCPLCRSSKIQDYFESLGKKFFLCENCRLIFLNSKNHLPRGEEKKRYDLHQNTPQNSNFLNYKKWGEDFLSWALIDGFKEILDYGSGPYPLLKEILREKKITCDHYDLYYFDELPFKKYDLILASEVVEHFRDVKEEFEKLVSFLNAEGFLVIRTKIKDEKIDFKSWAYRRDETHVSFYQRETFDYIAKKFRLKIIKICDDKISFQREK